MTKMPFCGKVKASKPHLPRASSHVFCHGIDSHTNLGLGSLGHCLVRLLEHADIIQSGCFTCASSGCDLAGRGRRDAVSLAESYSLEEVGVATLSSLAAALSSGPAGRLFGKVGATGNGADGAGRGLADG